MKKISFNSKKDCTSSTFSLRRQPSSTSPPIIIVPPPLSPVSLVLSSCFSFLQFLQCYISISADFPASISPNRRFPARRPRPGPSSSTRPRLRKNTYRPISSRDSPTRLIPTCLLPSSSTRPLPSSSIFNSRFPISIVWFDFGFFGLFYFEIWGIGIILLGI